MLVHQSSTVGTSQEELDAASDVASAVKKETQMLALNSPFPLYTVQDPSPGNGATHSGRVFNLKNLSR